jgi:hypothetical protein
VLVFNGLFGDSATPRDEAQLAWHNLHLKPEPTHRMIIGMRLDRFFGGDFTVGKEHPSLWELFGFSPKPNFLF